MSDNPFVLPKHEYKRDINVLKHYVEDSALYLSKMTGRPFEDCHAFVRAQLQPDGRFPFKDPQVFYLERADNGDRGKKTGTLSQYLGEAIKGHELIAPTLTTYLPPSQRKSLLVDYIDFNVKARSKAKKAKFEAEMAGDKPTETIKNLEQTNKKLANNAVSGAHVSPSTPLYNKTAHSTLTSNCRTTSGYGNANNEKFLCGNRHYWSADIVKNNIISIVNHSDYAAIAETMAEFGIRHPTVEETMECITRSTNLYWRSKEELDKIRRLIESLTEIERSAFVYTGDLYHLRKHNDQVVREFITQLSTRVGVVHPQPEAVYGNPAIPEEYQHLAMQLCPGEMKGRTLHKGKNAVKGTDAYGIVASTTEHIYQTIQRYRSLIRAFWVTPNMPASVAWFPDSVRHAAITSDTDSTIFTVQDWVDWHQGAVTFGDLANAVAATMIFLAAQAITHILARMSANFGIEESRVHQIAMKNEFKFDVFVPTQVAKHYFALIGCQEGNLFAEYKKEIKGVHLKSSNAPKFIMSEAERMMKFIMYAILEGKKIDLPYILKWIADIERGVKDSIQKASYEYFRSAQIKTPEGYKKPMESPYTQYLLWEEVFAPKYGSVPPPPYTAVKMSTEVDTVAKTKEWLANMKDRALAQRMEAWMLKYKGKISPVSTFQLPEQIISSTGIPEEILEVVGVRKIVLDTSKVFYIILETLGVYMLNDKMTRLVSDIY